MSIISRKGLIMANETTTKNDSTNVSFGKFKVGGYAYAAPVGTALPTDSESALDPAFQLIGYLSEAGITSHPTGVRGLKSPQPFLGYRVPGRTPLGCVD